MIEITGLTKSFGAVKAVQDVTFTAASGRVTGFLGPNGSGKTTTLAMLLGLIKPDAGSATIAGLPYQQLKDPSRVVGAALTANAHPAMTARSHLEVARRATGMPKARVAELLELVGLNNAADRKVGGFSLGMKQRLALATALVGDPQVLVLDEPINGLDPAGIRWIRLFLRHLAKEGKTVLLSSHLLSEVQHGVDDVIVINNGRLAFAGSLQELQDTAASETVLVDCRDRRSLAIALEQHGGEVSGVRSGGQMRVTNLGVREVGEIALQTNMPLTHLSVHDAGLEARFLELISTNEGQPQ